MKNNERVTYFPQYFLLREAIRSLSYAIRPHPYTFAAGERKRAFVFSIWGIFWIGLIPLVLTFGRFRFMVNDLAGKFGQMPLSQWPGAEAFRVIALSLFAWLVSFLGTPFYTLTSKPFLTKSNPGDSRSDEITPD
ncbi:hypothetical protein GC170_01365 [bacterium]|nr:hypothetical protein [bacterium]